MKIWLKDTFRHSTLVLLVFATALIFNRAAIAVDLQSMDVFYDFFMDQALDTTFSRGLRGLSLGGYRIGSTDQDPGISYSHLGVASTLWSNEHNQIMGGVEDRRYLFDRQVVLLDGSILPSRINDASAAILYKHITQSDWSISQSIRYNRIMDNLSDSGTNKINLVGTVAVSPRPGYVLAFGYLWSQEGFLNAASNRNIQQPLPLIEFNNGIHEEYSFIVGFPIMALTYHPDPDWTLAANWSFGELPAVSVSYRIRAPDLIRLSYGGDTWAYPLSDDDKKIRYSSRLLAVHWAHSQVLSGIPIQLSIVVGHETERKLGLLGMNDKITMDDAALIGFNLAIPF